VTSKRAVRLRPDESAPCSMQRGKLALRFLETIPSTFEALEDVRQKLMALAHEMKCGEEQLSDVELALHEALVNAVVHGNRQDPDKKVCVRCFCQPKRGMLLVVEDEGAGFDPNTVPDPTQAERLFESHGRGLYLIQRVVDRVRYSRSGRRLTMVKRLHR
jgi:serine/threonine-protein kinase RsbW